MKTNIKTILASTLFTAVFAGSYAIAGDNDHYAAADYETTSDVVEVKKVSFKTSIVEETVLSGEK